MKGPVVSPDLEQLELKLGMPWDGVDPRYLTKGHLLSRFGGTGRANLDAVGALSEESDRREVNQLWLFEDGVI